MNFDKIINSISSQEFKEPLLRGVYANLTKLSPTPETQNWMHEIEKELPPNALTQNWDSDTLTNIAYFAKAIATMHPGWEEWDKYPNLKKRKEQFISAIEKLYNYQSFLTLKNRLTGKDLLAELYKISKLLNDNHLEIFAIKKLKNGGTRSYLPVDRRTRLKFHPKRKGSVGKNLAFQSEFRKPDRHTRIFHLETGPLSIAERTINGKKVGIIGLSTCMVQFGSKHEASQKNAYMQIINTLNDNIKNWDNIILDVRGNHGGIPDYLQLIAKVICDCPGNEKPPYCMESRLRETEEAKLRIKHFYKPRTLKRSAPKLYSGKAKLFVLTDKETTSSAEFVYPLFKQYKNTQFIGESTGGCCQYGEVSRMTLPCGGILYMGNVFNDFGNSFMEGTGFMPDINCAGQDALQVAYENIKQSGSIQRRLSKGKEEGKEEGKEVGKDISIFPKWLKNPSWIHIRKR